MYSVELDHKIQNCGSNVSVKACMEKANNVGISDTREATYMEKANNVGVSDKREA